METTIPNAVERKVMQITHNILKSAAPDSSRNNGFKFPRGNIEHPELHAQASFPSKAKARERHFQMHRNSESLPVTFLKESLQDVLHQNK